MVIGCAGRVWKLGGKQTSKGRAGVTEQPTLDDGTGDAGSLHRRRTIHLSLHSNTNWSKRGLNMKGKNFFEKQISAGVSVRSWTGKIQQTAIHETRRCAVNRISTSPLLYCPLLRLPFFLVYRQCSLPVSLSSLVSAIAILTTPFTL